MLGQQPIQNVAPTQTMFCCNQTSRLCIFLLHQHYLFAMNAAIAYDAISINHHIDMALSLLTYYYTDLASY